ncbi:hypothetical protein ABZP36_023819 [Zizania latifolia]
MHNAFALSSASFRSPRILRCGSLRLRSRSFLASLGSCGRLARIPNDPSPLSPTSRHRSTTAAASPLQTGGVALCLADAEPSH